MKYLSKITSFILILILLTLSTTAFAENLDSAVTKRQNQPYQLKTVTVGITDLLYFSDKNEDGTYSGILCDYLKEIAKYAGWDLEYVEGTPVELLDQLTSGEIDLLGGMLKNDQTTKLYDYAEYSSGYSYSTLTVLRDNNRYIPMDYNSFEGMRVGIFKKARNRIALFESFQEANHTAMIPVYFDSEQDYLKCLETGAADAMLTNDTNVKPDHKIIAKFAPVPYYFGVTKGKTDLLRDLNAALNQLAEINPQFDDILYEKYISKKINMTLSLSESEMDYIKQAAPLKVTAIPDQAPIQSYDDKGQLVGISADVLELISKKTDLHFEYVKSSSAEEAYAMLRSGKADLIAGLYKESPNDSINHSAVRTRPYLSTQSILVKAQNGFDAENPIIAMPNGLQDSSISEGSAVQYYSSIRECINAVLSGKADYTISNSLVFDHYMPLKGNSKLTLIPLSNSLSEVSIGLSKPADPLLLTILDKAVYSITEEDLQSIIYQHTTTDNYDISLNSLIYTNPGIFILILSGISLIIILSVFIVMRMRLKLSQQIALNGEIHRQIGELTGEYIFEYDFETLELKISKKFADLAGIAPITKKNMSVQNSSIASHLFSLFASNNLDDGNSVEFKCELADGRKEWYRAVSTVLFNRHGAPIRGIGKLVNIQEEIQEKEELENRANKDSLTGLYNRQYCEHLIASFFEQGNHRTDGALILIDLDYFKQINDMLGHLAGDVVLKNLADVLREKVRPGDVIGRWGGDEFIIFMKNCSDSALISNQVETICRSMDYEFTYEGKSHPLSISVGIALTAENMTYNQLFQNADSALYRVKRGTRNGFKFYSKEPQS